MPRHAQFFSAALLLCSAFAPQISRAEIMVLVTRGESQPDGKPTVVVESRAWENINFSLLGNGYLKSNTLVRGATIAYSPPSAGKYRFKVRAGTAQQNGEIDLAAGERINVAIESDQPPPAPAAPAPTGPQTAIDFGAPPAQVLQVRNPFGPAFEKLSIDERLRLVQESPQAQELTPAERLQLLGVLYNEKGVHEAERKNFAEAEAVLRQAVQNIPGETTIQRNLAFAIAANGNALREQNQFSTAERKLIEALGMIAGGKDPKLEGQITSALASLFVAQAESFEGTEPVRRQNLLNKALQYDPNHPVALYRSGELAYEQYELQQALELFEKAYQFSPQQPLADLIQKVRLEIEQAGDHVTQDLGSFKISFDGREARHVARETRRLLIAAKREVGRDLDLRPEGTIAVVIYSAGQFQNILGLHSWAGGAYDGKIRLPIADLSESEISQNEGTLKKLVYHEYVHALLANRAGLSSIPVWLHEGLAQVVAGQEPGDTSLRHRVMDQVVMGTIPLPSRLSGDFASIADADTVQALYVESFLFIQYLLDDQGSWGRIRKLVAELVGGQSLDAAFETAYRKSLEDLEAEWIRSLG